VCVGSQTPLPTYYLNLDTRARGYERAAALEPGNARRNWFLLGRSLLYDFRNSRIASAVQSLSKARRFESIFAEALRDLAAAYDGKADTADARQAFLGRSACVTAVAGSWTGAMQLFVASRETGSGVRPTYRRTTSRVVETGATRAAEAFSPRAARPTRS